MVLFGTSTAERLCSLCPPCRRVGGLYAGLAPAVLRHLPYTGIRVLAFEQLRSLAQRHWASATTPTAAGQQDAAQAQALPLPVRLAIGLTAGGVAQFVAVPADLIKVRMQADGRLVAAGLQAAPRWGSSAAVGASNLTCGQPLESFAGCLAAPSSGDPLTVAVSHSLHLHAATLAADTRGWCTRSGASWLRTACAGCGAALCPQCNGRPSSTWGS